jgi:class 3 adenylate cyclase
MVTELFNLFIYTLFYYEIDNILKPYIYDKYDLFNDDPIIFSPIIQSTNIFILTLYALLTINLLFFSQIKNYTIYSLVFIYNKYVMDNVILCNKINIYQYEFRRNIMWLFTTPLILKIYSNMNNLNMKDINSHYHIFSTILHIILYPFRKTIYNYYIIIILFIGEAIFIYKLLQFKEQKYTKFIIYIWSIFSIISIIELLGIFNIQDIQNCYLLSDMIAKLTTILIVHDYEERMYHISNNIDLQGINLFTAIKKSIQQFENSTNITPKCKIMINHITDQLISFIPIDKTNLKLELLKKILPLELEDKYISQTKEHKPYDFVCVLFTDIVSYTELAKIYDADVIYKMLNDIYTRFDDILNRYENLQKIETIGDAYMVISDIYTNESKNNKSKNIKNIILLAIDFLKEIKYISSPNNVPLQLRIGINIGKVVVGILGVEIPRLCVIGNTVNVANRLQTTTDPDTIQISRHVYEIANEIDFGINIHFELKENVYLKNIGITNTYILNCI